MKTLLTFSVLGFLALTSAQAQQKAPAKQPAKSAAVTAAKPKPAPAKTATAKPAPAKPTVAKATPASQSQPAVASAKPQPAPQEEQVASVPAEPRQSAPAPQASAKSQRSSSFSHRSAASGRNKYLNAGIGLGTYGAGGLPIGASFEVDLKNNISIGGSFDYSRYTYRSYGYNWNYSFYYVGARASYHAAELLNVGNDKFDPYAGLSLGFHGARYKDNGGYYGDYASPYSSGLFIGIHVGARYYFTEKIGGFAELGYGVSALKLGLTAKF